MKHYFKSDEIIDAFRFLITKGFAIIKLQDSNAGSMVELSNESIRVHLLFDYKDYFFYFSLIRGKETQYPNDFDKENILPFSKIGSKYISSFDPQTLNPNFHENSLSALQNNAALLENYGQLLLEGQEWE